MQKPPASMDTQADFNRLVASVQLNCDIADARHARDYSLCVYLLKMREYYRWEQGHGFAESLSRDAIGSWVTARELRWDDLEDADFQPLLISGDPHDPFDTESINARLMASKWVYSGGYGRGGYPHFFLAELLRMERHGQHTLFVTGREYARDLTSPPGMALNGTIFIRRESLRRMLWEKVEEWRWHRYENAMGRALSYYDLENELDQALESMTDSEIESVLLHEIGEVQAGELLGEAWHDMLMALPHSQAEIMARAVRDHMADCLSTLPGLIERNNPAQLHFFFGNLRAMRKEISPSLMQAYTDWCQDGKLHRLQSMAKKGAAHWQRVAGELLGVFSREGSNSARSIEALVQDNYF